MNKILWKVGVWFYRQINRRDIVRSHSRKTLEYHLFYAIHKEIRPKRILFVGVAPYTRYYHRLFANVFFTTIDNDPKVAKWGAPGHHTCIDTANIAEVFGYDIFDAVLLNGVYGWGTNTAQHLKKVLENTYITLRPGGLLVFGWNQTKEYDPLDIENNLSEFFGDYTACTLQGNHRVQFHGWENHAFRFFRANKRNKIEI